MNNLIAFIPARSGSKRIPEKNTRLLGGKPLMVYTIEVAKKCKLFDAIYVSSDSLKTGELAKNNGVEFIHCPLSIAHKDNDPDQKWIDHAISTINNINSYHFYMGIETITKPFYFYCILRPTNPFRTSPMIHRAWREWDKTSIMKAIAPVEQHPFKMWNVNERYSDMEPFCETVSNLHLEPTQNSRKVYIQNGSLEFRSILYDTGKYQPFFTRKIESFDINDEFDWIIAERIISEKDTFQNDRR